MDYRCKSKCNYRFYSKVLDANKLGKYLGDLMVAFGTNEWGIKKGNLSIEMHVSKGGKKLVGIRVVHLSVLEGLRIGKPNKERGSNHIYNCNLELYFASSMEWIGCAFLACALGS